MTGSPVLWQRRQPFAHCQASNVFDDATHAQLVTAVHWVERESGQRSTQASTKYDAQIWRIDPRTSGRFAPLFTPKFLQGLARLARVPFYPIVDGAVHIHHAGSRSGWVHTDLCSGWFDKEAGQADDGLLYPDASRCDYFTGYPRSSESRPVEYVRAASLIYFLDNDDWQPGHGGETALFEAKESTTPHLLGPRSNTMLIFENSPHSYHRFQKLLAGRRTSIALWLHVPTDVAIARWGTGVNRRKPT